MMRKLFFWSAGIFLLLPFVALAASGQAIPFPYTFAKTLQLGSKNIDVIELQWLLKAKGTYGSPITGSFDSFTRVAVKKYQAQHGLKRTGVVDLATRVN